MIISETFFQRNVFRPLVAGLAIAALVSVLGSTADAAATQGRVCKPSHVVGKGEHRSKIAATRMAIMDWQQKANAAHGANFKRWGRSLGRALNCSPPNPARSRNWRCSAVGKPCRPNFSSTREGPNVRSPKSRIKLRRQP